MTLELDWQLIKIHSISLSIAYLIALPIAWNREVKTHSAGLRTFPLVSVATCGFMLIAIHTFTEADAQARVLQGIITGIGFIGGGAILKNDHAVSGTATATSIWATGAIGIAVAWQRYEIALLLCLLTFITLQFFSKAKHMIEDDKGE